MEVSALPRRERERLMRRKDMLRAARAVFAEKGYTNATLDEIAQRAEYGKGTLYNYFPGGKEEILFAILDEVYDEMCDLIETAFAAGDEEPFRETLGRFLESALTFFEERQDLFLVMMKEANGLFLSEDAEKSAYFLRQQNRIIGAMVGPLAAAMEAGRLRPLPPEAVAHTILGNVKGLQMHLCMSRHQRGADCAAPVHMAPTDAADFLKTVLLDGMCLEHPQPAERSTS